MTYPQQGYGPPQDYPHGPPPQSYGPQQGWQQPQQGWQQPPQGYEPAPPAYGPPGNARYGEAGQVMPPAPPQQGYGPSQGWQQPPPPQPYGQQGYGPPQGYGAPQGAWQQPPAQMPRSSIEDWLNQPASGGPRVNKILSDGGPGTRIIVRTAREVTDRDTEVVPDFNDRSRPRTRRDGSLVQQLNLPVLISHPAIQGSEAVLRVTGQLQQAIADGMAAAGIGQGTPGVRLGVPEKDSTLDITREQDRPIPGRAQGQHVFRVFYTRPPGAAQGNGQQPQAQIPPEGPGPWQQYPGQPPSFTQPGTTPGAGTAPVMPTGAPAAASPSAMAPPAAPPAPGYDQPAGQPQWQPPGQPGDMFQPPPPAPYGQQPVPPSPVTQDYAPGTPGAGGMGEYTRDGQSWQPGTTLPQAPPPPQPYGMQPPGAQVASAAQAGVQAAAQHQPPQGQVPAGPQGYAQPQPPAVPQGLTPEQEAVYRQVLAQGQPPQ